MAEYPGSSEQWVGMSCDGGCGRVFGSFEDLNANQPEDWPGWDMEDDNWSGWKEEGVYDGDCYPNIYAIHNYDEYYNSYLTLCESCDKEFNDVVKQWLDNRPKTNQSLERRQSP